MYWDRITLVGLDETGVLHTWLSCCTCEQKHRMLGQTLWGQQWVSIVNITTHKTLLR